MGKKPCFDRTERATKYRCSKTTTGNTFNIPMEREKMLFVVSLSLPCHSFKVFSIWHVTELTRGRCRTHKGMAELRGARRYRVIHLRLAAKLEMQLTISAFCFSAPHMLRRKGGKGDRTRGCYKPLPQPQVSLAQLAQWLH